MISLSVEPGIEPGIFRFQSKVLATPLPSLRSSSTFLLFPLTLLFFLSLPLCFFFRSSSTFFSASHREKASSLFSFNGLKVDYWNSGEYFSFLSPFISDYWPARQTQTNPLLSRATVSLTFMSTLPPGLKITHVAWRTWSFVVGTPTKRDCLDFFIWAL